MARGDRSCSVDYFAWCECCEHLTGDPGWAFRAGGSKIRKLPIQREETAKHCCDAALRREVEPIETQSPWIMVGCRVVSRHAVFVRNLDLAAQRQRADSECGGTDTFVGP